MRFELERGAGNICERVLWTIQRADVGAAVEKSEQANSAKLFSPTARGENECERVLWTIQRADVGAAVEKSEQANSAKLFRQPQEGSTGAATAASGRKWQPIATTIATTSATKKLERNHRILSHRLASEKVEILTRLW